MARTFRMTRLSIVAKGLEDQHIELARTVVAEARQMLTDCPCPDTFLGRKTQEPFPTEEKS